MATNDQVLGFQVSEFTRPEEFAEVARRGGMRLVCESGFTPWSVNFIPDIARRGEIKWVDAHDSAALREAVQSDPDQAPVVIRKSLAKLLLQIAANSNTDLVSITEGELAELHAAIAEA